MLASCLVASSQTDEPSDDSTPLEAAHAHNDYWHERPLFDAVDLGFCSVEADVILKDGKLLVGHEPRELQETRTLETLYLAPLADRVRENGGFVFPQRSRFFLLIDVKSDAKSTYEAIDQLLEKYSAILTSVEAGHVKEGAITVVISGNRDQETIRGQQRRFAGIDGRAVDLESSVPSHVMPWISENWNSHFSWKGDGPMPRDQKEKLRGYVKQAHEQGRLVRFWATPESEVVWKELVAAEVDLIGSDDLKRLQRFLLEQRSSKE